MADVNIRLGRTRSRLWCRGSQQARKECCLLFSCQIGSRCQFPLRKFSFRWIPYGLTTDTVLTPRELLLLSLQATGITLHAARRAGSDSFVMGIGYLGYWNRLIRVMLESTSWHKDQYLHQIHKCLLISTPWGFQPCPKLLNKWVS